MRQVTLIAIACLAVSGCAVPGWTVPDSKKLYTESQKVAAGGQCGDSLIEAKNCARFLIDELSSFEVASGRWDTAYSLGMVGLGTLGAVYLKSDTDRTQAIEDLAVIVATLTGIRSVLAPDERRKVAREGREAVECMLAAAEGLERVTGKPNQDKGLVAARLAEIKTSDEDPFTTFNTRVAAQFGLNVSPNEGVAADKVERFRTGTLLRARGAQLESALEKTTMEALIAQENVDKKLGYGVTQVLNNVRSALSEPALAVADIVKTQRDQVQAMIGELSKAIENEQDEAKKMEGAAAVLPDAPEVPPEATSTPKAAAKRQLQSVYAECVAPE